MGRSYRWQRIQDRTRAAALAVGTIARSHDETDTASVAVLTEVIGVRTWLTSDGARLEDQDVVGWQALTEVDG